jgi:peptidoglycan-N-acetylglucosamine deacetylase
MRPITTAALSATVALAGSAAYFSPWFWRRYRMSGIRREVVKGRMLALTYDDGPSPGLTPQILDLLQSRGVHATFFMLGQQAGLNPEIADRVIREGHEVGCHSSRHLNAWKSAPWNATEDIRAGYEQLARWLRPNAIFRPPYGKMTLPTYFEVRSRDASVWWWTLDSGDTHATRPSPTLVADNLHRERGGIVLLHDLDREAERNDFVLRATEALLDVAKRESMQVVTLSQISK